jgi:competence protein ComEC
MGRWVTAALAAVEREQDRWFLWSPVMLGCGIALYFALTFEPPPLATAAAAVMAILIFWRWREGIAAALIGGVAVASVLGFALAQLRTHSVSAPLVAG